MREEMSACVHPHLSESVWPRMCVCIVGMYACMNVSYSVLYSCAFVYLCNFHSFFPSASIQCCHVLCLCPLQLLRFHHLQVLYGCIYAYIGEYACISRQADDFPIQREQAQVWKADLTKQLNMHAHEYRLMHPYSTPTLVASLLCLLCSPFCFSPRHSACGPAACARPPPWPELASGGYDSFSLPPSSEPLPAP